VTRHLGPAARDRVGLFGLIAEVNGRLPRRRPGLARLEAGIDK